jgi:hypothetical protein
VKHKSSYQQCKNGRKINPERRHWIRSKRIFGKQLFPAVKIKAGSWSPRNKIGMPLEKDRVMFLSSH